MQIKVFHVDLQEEMLLPIRDLGKRAIFTGPRGVVLLPGTNYYSSVDRGTMYFGLEGTKGILVHSKFVGVTWAI